MGNEDYYNGLSGAVAVLMAIECREHAGRVQTIESAQLRSALFATTHNFLEGDVVHRPFEIDSGQRGTGPTNQLFPTADGWVMVAAGDDAPGAALRRLLDLPEEAPADRVAAALTEALAVRSGDDAAAWLAAGSVPSEVAVAHPRMPELLWDEWLAETGRVLEHHHPTWGWIREIGLLSHLSATPGVRKGHGPVLGQNTREILAELGIDDAELAELEAAGVCVAANGGS